MTASLVPDLSQDFGVHKQLRLGRWMVAGFIVVILGWGFTARLAGAVVAHGAVAVETGPKRVQHAQGGVVAQVFVVEGQEVRRNQVLARLEPTVVSASAALSKSRFDELEARRLRLVAERDGLALHSAATDRALAPVLAAERRQMQIRQTLVAEKRAQLLQEMAQTEAEIDGLQRQLRSGDQEARLIGGELAGMRSLHAQGYAPVTRLNALEREAQRLEGERGARIASIARARARIAQIRVQTLQVGSEYADGVMSELKDTQLQLAQARQQRVADQDQAQRLDLRAPASGRVQQLVMRTAGGVLAPGEALMMIVPTGDRLIVEARISPEQIDRVQVGQGASLKFTAFGGSTTPEVSGRVERVAATVQRDEQSGALYYVVACAVTSGDPRMLGRLKAGMPVEVHIATGSRSAMSYFLKPLSDQIGRAFKEP